MIGEYELIESADQNIDAVAGFLIGPGLLVQCDVHFYYLNITMISMNSNQKNEVALLLLLAGWLSFLKLLVLN